MNATSIFRIAVVFAIIGFSAGCANTIRGAGQDTANAVDATQQAGNNVAGAAD